jgi:hypothetical protein
MTLAQAGKSGCTAAEAKAMSAPELKAKYADMFGVECNSSNGDWIRKKVRETNARNECKNNVREQCKRNECKKRMQEQCKRTL